MTSAAPTPTADQLQWMMLNNGGVVLLVVLVFTAITVGLSVVVLSRAVSRATAAA